MSTSIEKLTAVIPSVVIQIPNNGQKLEPKQARPEPPAFVEGEIRAMQLLGRDGPLLTLSTLKNDNTPMIEVKPDVNTLADKKTTNKLPPYKLPAWLTAREEVDDEPKDTEATGETPAEVQVEPAVDKKATTVLPEEKIKDLRRKLCADLVSALTGGKLELTNLEDIPKIDILPDYSGTIIAAARGDLRDTSKSDIAYQTGLNPIIREAVSKRSGDLLWIKLHKDHNFAKGLMEYDPIRKIIEHGEANKQGDQTTAVTESDGHDEKIIEIAQDLIKYLTTGGDLPPYLARIIERDLISKIKFRKEDVPKVVEAAKNKRRKLDYGLKIVFPLAKNKYVIDEVVNGGNSKAHIKWICEHINSAFAFTLAYNKEIKVLIRKEKDGAKVTTEPDSKKA